MWVPRAHWDAMWHTVGPTFPTLTKLQTALTPSYELGLLRRSHRYDHSDEHFNLKLSLSLSCHFEFRAFFQATSG